MCRKHEVGAPNAHIICRAARSALWLPAAAEFAGSGRQRIAPLSATLGIRVVRSLRLIMSTVSTVGHAM